MSMKTEFAVRNSLLALLKLDLATCDRESLRTISTLTYEIVAAQPDIDGNDVGAVYEALLALTVHHPALLN